MSGNNKILFHTFQQQTNEKSVFFEEIAISKLNISVFLLENKYFSFEQNPLTHS